MRSRATLFSPFFLLACALLCLYGADALAQAPASASTTATTAATAYVAGRIDLMEGDVRIYDKQNARRTSKVGDKVYEGDSIVTGANGEIHMTMDDQGFIAVRPNTKMRILQYRAEGDDDDKGVIGLLVGSLRSVTGWIGKYHPKSYSINTPTATIGIRGTDHEPKVIPEGSSEGDAGTYDKVNAGGSFINTPQGNVDVTPNHAAFAPHNGRAAPRMLAAVPNFFRPTRNEHLIEGKHDQIQRQVEQRREERRQQIKSGLRPTRPPGPAHLENAARAGLNNGARPNPLQRMQQERQARMQAPLQPHPQQVQAMHAQPPQQARMQPGQATRTAKRQNLQQGQNRQSGTPQGYPQQMRNEIGRKNEPQAEKRGENQKANGRDEKQR